LFDATPSVDLLDRIGEGVFGLDHDGRFAYLNAPARRLLRLFFGLELPEPVGRLIWEQSPAIDAGPLGWALRRASAEMLPVTAAVQDGTGAQVEIRAYPSDDGVFVLLLESRGPQSPEVLDRISDLYLACDAEWRLTLLNASAREYLRRAGRDPGALLGRNVWESVPALRGSRFQSEAFRAVAEQSESEFDARFAPLDRWFAVRITPMADGVVASARDITGARRRERALAHEAERLSAVIETQQAVATAGPELGPVMRVVCERLQRLTRAPAVAVFLPEDGDLVLCEGAGYATGHLGLRVPRTVGLPGHALTTGEILRCDDTRTDVRSDPSLAATLHARSGIFAPLTGSQEGRAVVALWSDRPAAFTDLHERTVRLVAGLLAAAMEQARTVAAHQLLLGERTATMAALRAGEERFRTLVESIDDVVFRLDRQQRCVDIMGRWLAREGYRPEEFLGRTTREIVGTAEAAMHERAGARALAGETVTYEWTLDTARGPRHMQTTLSPLAGPEGEIAGIVGLGRDITQRIEAEQQIRQAQKMEAVGRFAGGVAHDLNNMMMIIVGFSDFLLSTLEQHDPRRSDADEIRKAAERSMHLTRQLLGFGRQRLVAREVISLNTVVEGMERMLRPLLGEDIELLTALAPELGGVEADYGQLEQVVMNLALNARDAMRGGGRFAITTRNVELPDPSVPLPPGVEVPAGPYVLLIASDTGHGMTAEVKTHLFEPFFTTKPATQNTGLGLTTVYGIVVQSGGYIWVDSEPGHGAAFQLCFPRVPVDEAGDADLGRPVPTIGGSETVLVVEDEEAVRTLASRVLGQYGYTVIEARNGLDAVQLLEERQPSVDLVLTDVVMPEMSGLELSRRLAVLRPSTPVLFMSGYTESEKLQPDIRETDAPFLQKPFSAESLMLRIREALDRANR
jgi:two-component system, cell cycle sensor histidine kinase and response regulator CckA